VEIEKIRLISSPENAGSPAFWIPQVDQSNSSGGGFSNDNLERKRTSSTSSAGLLKRRAA